MDNKVIMYIDGGICSQMFRYAKGQWFAKKGFNVLYDLTWFDDWGMDMLGKRKFPFELHEMFPSLNINVADREQIEYYKYNYSTEYIVKNTDDLNPPLYVNMYDRDDILGNDEFDFYRDIFPWKQLHNEIGKKALKVYNDIEEKKKNNILTIGVHVRRGDMAIYNGIWPVLSPEYFKRAANMAKKIAWKFGKGYTFYFFSDGFDFVNNEIIPFIDGDYSTVDYGFKDYEDLYLLSQCDVQIASQGSFGKIAYCFNDNLHKQLIIPGYQNIKGIKENDKNGIIKVKMDDGLYISKGQLSNLNDTNIKKIKIYKKIKQALAVANKNDAKIAIFPFGSDGRIYNRIFNETFNYKPIIFDNSPVYKGTGVQPLYQSRSMKSGNKIMILMTIDRPDIRRSVDEYFSEDEIFE